jgi:hypothetical protein
MMNDEYLMSSSVYSGVAGNSFAHQNSGGIVMGQAAANGGQSIQSKRKNQP